MSPASPHAPPELESRIWVKRLIPPRKKQNSVSFAFHQIIYQPPAPPTSTRQIRDGCKVELLDLFSRWNSGHSGHEQDRQRESPQKSAKFISELHCEDKIEPTVLKDVPVDDPLVKD